MLCGISIADDNWGWCYLHVWMLRWCSILVHSAIFVRYEHCITSENNQICFKLLLSLHPVFFFLFVCLFSNQIIICLLVNHTGAVGLPKSTSVVQTEISLYLFDGLPIKFYTDIHGSREWSLLTSVISHFSSSGMMRLAFMGHREMSQQLLDGCN